MRNHVRAVVGLPLGVIEPIVPPVMVNLVGSLPADDAMLGVPGAKPAVAALRAESSRQKRVKVVRAVSTSNSSI